MTYGIKYAGSKQKLIPHILNEVIKLSPKTFLDAFSGTTRVSQAVAQQGIDVCCNDISEVSHILGNAFLTPRNDKEAHRILAHLNSVQPKEGWFSKHYGGELDESKKVWQKKNTKKLDAIREEIDLMELGEPYKSIALASLIMGLDRVDSSLGHYVSYLREWSARSFNNLELTLPFYAGAGGRHRIIKSDILEKDLGHFDVAYLDPPYGSNNEKMPPSRVRYAAYYHLWTTIIRNDQPSVFGVANRRSDSSDKVAGTPFEDFRKDDDGNFIALKAIEKTIAKIDSKYIILSYSSGGRASLEHLKQMLSNNGRLIGIKFIDYKKHIMSSMTRTKKWTPDRDTKHQEFLFVLDKS